MSYDRDIKQWEVIGVDLGEAEKYLKDDMGYSKKEIVEDLKGVNLGAEMSKFHRCVVLLEGKFNKGDSILVAPFSSYKEGDDGIEAVLVVDYDESTKKFLEHKSTLQLTRLRSVSRQRINKHYGFLPRGYSRKVIGKLKSMLEGNI